MFTSKLRKKSQLGRVWFVLWWENDLNRILPQLYPNLYNCHLSSTRGDTSQDGHGQSQLLLAWDASKKKVSYG
jgi:hypothetical protein